MKGSITRKSTIEEVAAIVCQALHDHGVDAVLTGGAVVSIYSDNEYESRDLDFITHATRQEIQTAMEAAGFRRTPGRHFEHSKTDIIVEFPTPPLAIGDEHITKWAKKKTGRGLLQLLAPTECVMDRLARFYHWRDLQALDQAIAVARRHPIRWARLEKWSRAEGMTEKLEVFRTRLAAVRKAKRK